MSPERRSLQVLSRGLSLVELLVGVAVGLFIVAAASVMVSGQLGENRKLLLETQLQQDLRATSDIITRELRRVGAWGTAWDGISYADFNAQNNALTVTTPASGTVAPPDEFLFRYQRPDGQIGQWGFKLQNGVIRTRLGDVSGWQDLTDGATMVVESFAIDIKRAPGQQLPCPNLCTGGTVSCWPTLHVRDFEVTITARAANDAAVRRSIRSSVRARNDWVEFLNPGSPPQVCPA